MRGCKTSTRSAFGLVLGVGGVVGLLAWILAPASAVAAERTVVRRVVRSPAKAVPSTSVRKPTRPAHKKRLPSTVSSTHASVGDAGQTPQSNASGAESTVPASDGSTPGGATRDASATSPTTPNNAAPADVRLTKISNGSFKVGGEGTYVLTISNNGPASTDGPITLVDLLPDGLRFIEAIADNWSCELGKKALNCTRTDPLAASDTAVITLRVMVLPDAFPSVTNIAFVSYAGDTDPSNNTGRRPTTIDAGTPHDSPTPTPTAAGPAAEPTPTATASPIPVNAAETDLRLVKTTSGPFSVGSDGIYVLTVSNVGDRATNATITVIDPLPEGLSYVMADGDIWNCSASENTVTCTNTTPLEAGASANIALRVRIGRAALPTVTNTAVVIYQGDTNPENDSARKPTTIRN